MSFNYKNPITPISTLGSISVQRKNVFGTNFSILSTGGYMEVYNINELYYTIPSSTTGLIEYSGNTIPIQLNKGTGSPFSFDVLTLNSDNISSGRRRLGMLVYVIDEDQVYQYQIPNFISLWNSATGATGLGGNTVIFSDFGTTVKSNTPEGVAFISAWTSNVIEGVSGGTSVNSTWKKLVTGGGAFTGGTVTGDTIFTSGLTATTFSASTYLGLPIDVYVTGGTYSSGTATFTNNTGGTFDVLGFYTGETDDNTYITGFTYSSNTFTISDNSGSTFDATFNEVTGLTINGDLSVTGNTNVIGFTADTISATTYQNLPIDPDTYITGFTYSANTFTISDNSGTTFNSTFNDVTGLTINGDIIITGTSSASTFNITTTPNTNITDTDVLVRNSVTGEIENRSINSLLTTNNTITVALTGSMGVDFNKIKDAVNSITGATSANTYTVKVYGGIYNEDPFTIPSWVAVVGDSSISTIIQANDTTQSLIKLSDQSAIFDCQVQGCTDTNVSAILYSSSTTPQSAAIAYVENVRFGTNYTHAKVVASGGANIILQCSNVKYGGYPFTIGFYATNDGSGIGRMQLRNVTSTNGGIVSTTGLTFAKADAASCGFIVNGCLLTKATAGGAAGTGFYVENGGFLRLTAVNFQRWNIGIDAPQIGSAPSIDAIALNFENNNTDVNIAHSGATGKIQGTDSFLKTKININAPLYEVNTDPRQIIVSKKGGDFSSIKSAIDYLSLSANTSSSNRYVVNVGPGEFYEGEINLTNTPYVSIVGSNIQTTLIIPTGSTHHILSIGVNNEISFLSFSGAGSGYAAINCDDIGDFGQSHKCSFYDCDINVLIKSSSVDTKFFGEYLDFNGEYSYGVKIEATNNYLALANMENYYNFPTGSNITYCNHASGSGATISIFVGDNVSNGVSGTTAFYIEDGAQLYASTITSDGCTYAVWNPNIGLPCRFDVDNASFVSGEWDLYIERIGTFGTFGGSSNHEKIYTVSSDVYWSFLDIEDGELDITRKASVTFTDGSHTDFTTLIFEGGTMGVMSGGTITLVSATTINTAAGYGYLETSADTGIIRRIDWNDSNLSLSSNTENYIYINENGILSAAGSIPNTFFNILLGRVITNLTTVEFIEQTPQNANHTSNRFSTFNRVALGPVYATGSIVTEGTTPFSLDVSAGVYFFSENEFMPSGGIPITFTQYYRDGLGGWITSATTGVTNSYYDGNGSLSGLTGYTKHTLYVVGDGIDEKYFLVLGQNQYSSLVQAEGALLPTPPTYFDDAVTQIANIYVQSGMTGITQIEDIRPVIGFKAGGVNASSLHANLLGLSSDDHLQYLLVNGGRAMSGNLDMGGNNIVSAGTINTVTIQSHATRHQFGGLDPVGSVTPGPNYIPYADVSGKLDSWITPITISGGTGILTGGTYPNFTLLNSAPDQTVTISGGTNISVTGTYPNFTVSQSGSGFTGGTVTGATNFTGGLTANTFSATTLSINGRLGVGSTPSYGNSGQILTSAGSSLSPTWSNPATTVNTSANYNIVMATASNTSLVTGTGNGGTAATLNPYTGQMSIAGLSVYGYGMTLKGPFGVGNNPGTINYGTSGQVLTSNGSSGNVGPSWVTPYIFTGGTVTGATNFTGGLTANTISATTFYGDGSNLTNLPSFTSTTSGSLGININNGLTVISTGFKGYVKMPYDGTINGWTIMGSVSGSVSIDVWKDSESNFPPTSGDTITGGNYPNLTNQFINSDNVLTGWNTNFNANDIFTFNVLTVSGVTNINLTINVTKN